MTSFFSQAPAEDVAGGSTLETMPATMQEVFEILGKHVDLFMIDRNQCIPVYEDADVFECLKRYRKKARRRRPVLERESYYNYDHNYNSNSYLSASAYF